MTLIVAVATEHHAFHASDRYVSVQPTPRNPRPDWDLHANKTVVAIGSDSWIVLGYTGLAYLDGKPTDQLIAEAISGHADLSGGAAFIPWGPSHLPHYREMRDRVEQKLADAYSRLPTETANKHPTLILASGVQRKRGLNSGVMFQITAQGSATAAVELLPSRLVAGKYYFGAVGMVNKEIIDGMERSIGDAKSLEGVRDLLMDAVIETSNLTDYVGDDVVGVILDNSTETVSSHFRPANPQRQAELVQQVAEDNALLKDQPQFQEMASVSTPYVITPGTIFAPSIGNPGGWSMSSGISFNYTGFDYPQPKPGGAYFAGQPRRKKP